MHVVPAGEKAGILFTGDILFVGTIGRCDFPYSDYQKLFKSLARLKDLDDATIFYPGHDYGRVPFQTLGQEKKTNPFLMADSLDSFRRLLHR